MQPIDRSRIPLLPLAVAIVLAALGPVVTREVAAEARPAVDPGPVPATCVANSPAGDYRCAGLMLPGGLWAGQWLFTDEAGQYRLGTCTYHLGTHPTAAANAHQVPVALPNDPGAVRSGYLAWRYGATGDDLTAAAMWAVMHFYAQDTAGGGPLFPTLDAVGAFTGRPDVQQRALDLAAEAERFAGEWHLSVTLADGGTATITLLAGANPVPDRPISVLVSGADLPLAATTGADGTTTVAVTLPPSGTVTVVASTPAPRPAAVYAGQPAAPDPDGVQTLLTSGGEVSLQATARWTFTPAPTTTAQTTDQTTTTVAEVRPPATDPPLPDTGRGDGGIAHLATALLVGGVGLLGTLRRREARLTRGRVHSRA